MKEDIFPQVELIDHIEMLSTINCSICEMQDFIHEDFSEAIDYFYERGWRVEKDKCFCPACMKNKTKKK